MSSLIQQELKDLSGHNRIKALEKRVSTIAQEWNAKNIEFQNGIKESFLGITKVVKALNAQN